MAGKPRKIDYDYALRAKKVDSVVTVSLAVVRWAGAAFILFFLWRISLALGGKSTSAQFGLDFVADLKTSNGIVRIVTLLFGISGYSYGYKQRKLRRADSARRAARETQLKRRSMPSALPVT